MAATKRLIYQVNTIDPLVGEQSKLYEWCIASVERYCKKYNIDHHVQLYPILKIGPLDWKKSNRSENCRKRGFLPIYEKENAFERFDKYDQIAIIDSDIFIHDHAPNIFDAISPEVDFGGVIEREMPITPEYQNKIKHYSASQYQWLHEKGYGDFKPNKLGYEFFNMGMMVMNKSITKYINGTPKEFIQQPEFKRFVDGLGAWKWSTDQTLLNYWVRNSGMKQQHLSWKWNALFKGIRDDWLPKAHFIHFFLKDKLPARGENVNLLMQELDGNTKMEHKHI